MNQSFKHNGLTIEVRALTGIDLIDNPQLNRIVLDFVADKPSALLSDISPVVWNRITTYVDFLQVSTVTGKGLHFPSPDDSADVIGKGYQEWLAYIGMHPECYRQWDKLRQTVNKQIPDPQSESAETTSASK